MRHCMKEIPKRIVSIVFMILTVFITTNCASDNTEEKMKQDVKNYFKYVEENNFPAVLKLSSGNNFDDEGGQQADFFFIKTNYAKINPNDSLLKDMKIEDSYIISPQIKSKQIVFEIKPENDSLNLIRPLILSFIFDVPYQENSMDVRINNRFEWRDNKPDFK